MSKTLNYSEHIYIVCPDCRTEIELSVLELQLKIVGFNIQCKNCGYKGRIEVNRTKEGVN